MRKVNQYRSQVREYVFRVANFFTKLQSGVVCLKDCGETELKQYVSSTTGQYVSIYDKGIQYPENILNSELYEITKANKEKYTELKLDRLMEQHCHRVLRLPPYHPELNPIENIWCIVQNRIALANVEFISTKIEQMIKNEFDKVSSEEWRNTCRHIWDQENKFIQQEHVMDSIINETTTTDTSSN